MLRVKKRGTSVAICQTRDVQLHNHLAIAQLINNAKEHTTIPHKKLKDTKYNVVRLRTTLQPREDNASLKLGELQEYIRNEYKPQEDY